MSSTPTASVSDDARRPLKTRQTRWAGATAGWLVKAGASPNGISIASIAFAAIAGAAYAACAFVNQPLAVSGLLVLACVGIQGRLLCNMLDGMVAVEGGKKSSVGEIYNDVPDRVADAIILTAAGYAAGAPWGPTLGWAATVVALLTAYARVLGRSLGAGVYFIGPMAKQHRMAALTAANLLAACLTVRAWHSQVLLGCLALIIIGGLLTAGRRLGRIVRDLRAGAAS
jgi:phosphatidylglycerophosphate synthase